MLFICCLYVVLLVTRYIYTYETFFCSYVKHVNFTFVVEFKKIEFKTNIIADSKAVN